MTTPLKIQPAPPLAGGLDAVATDLPMAEKDWRIGVEVTPPARNGVHLWDASGCVSEGYALDNHETGDDPLEEKLIGDVAAGHAFYPTIIVAQAACHVAGSMSAVGNLIRENAQHDLELNKWRALEAVLHGNAPVFDPTGLINNPSISQDNGNTAPTYPAGFDAAAPGDLRGTMQGLLDGICECSKSNLIFHAPVSFLPYFLTDGVVRWDAESGVYRYGNHVFSFGCYPNRGDNALELATPTATDGSEAWIWATGPIYTAFSEVDEVVDLHRVRNTYTAQVERAAIVAFDPTCVRAAKATVA